MRTRQPPKTRRPLARRIMQLEAKLRDARLDQLEDEANNSVYAQLDRANARIAELEALLRRKRNAKSVLPASRGPKPPSGAGKHPRRTPTRRR